MPTQDDPYIASLKNEIKQLQAIVDKLPKTANGVPVVPFGGTIVWVYTRHSGLYRPGEGKQWWPMRVNAFENGFLYGMVDGSHYAHVRPEECYSTLKAAEDAK